MVLLLSMFFPRMFLFFFLFLSDYEFSSTHCAYFCFLTSTRQKSIQIISMLYFSISPEFMVCFFEFIFFKLFSWELKLSFLEQRLSSFLKRNRFPSKFYSHLQLLQTLLLPAVDASICFKKAALRAFNLFYYSVHSNLSHILFAIFINP